MPISYPVRAIRLIDAEALYRIMTSPKAAAGTLQSPYNTPDGYRKRLESPPPGRHTLVACDEHDTAVGMLGLDVSQNPRQSHSATLGMAVRDDWQGRGVGSALLAAAVDMADNWLQLRRLELTVYTDNEPALALYTKFGFVIEGTLRRATFRLGQYCDSHIMSRLHDMPA